MTAELDFLYDQVAAIGTRVGVAVPTPPWRIGEGQRVYTVQAGDTLASIAGSYLADPGRAEEIRQLNQEQLPEQTSQPLAGMHLQLPAE